MILLRRSFSLVLERGRDFYFDVCNAHGEIRGDSRMDDANKNTEI